MHTQQSGSAQLLEVKINSSVIPISIHEKTLLKRQQQFKRLAQWAAGKPNATTNIRQLARATCCARVLLRVNDGKAPNDLGEMPTSGRFRWVYACRQSRWCSRCAAIEREARAVRFAEAAVGYHVGKTMWSVIVSPKRPDMPQEMFDRAELCAAMLQSVNRSLMRSLPGDKPIYAAGIHTQPQSHGMLWPHLHLTLIADVTSPKEMMDRTAKWLRSQKITGVKLSVKNLGLVGSDKTELDVKRFYQYVTRHDDVDDGEHHPVVRAAVMDKVGLKRNYSASALPKEVELYRCGFPNSSVPRKWLTMLAMDVEKNTGTFRRSEFGLPKHEADLLYSQALEQLGQIDG